MKRNLDWRAFPGILIDIIMIIFGVTFFIVPALTSHNFSWSSLIFPLIWIGIILLAGIQATRRFLGMGGVLSRRDKVLSNLYGPEDDKNYQENIRKRYLKKDDAEQNPMDVSEALYQLELMKMDDTISDEEYRFVKNDLLKKQKQS